jgi:hypothetical protein
MIIDEKQDSYANLSFTQTGATFTIYGSTKEGHTLFVETEDPAKAVEIWKHPLVYATKE